MNIKNRTKMAQTCLWTVALVSIAATLASGAGTPSAYLLNARLVPRPLTAGDVATYGLPASTEYSGGLYTLGIGTPVYLEVDVTLNAAYSSTITNITWTNTTAPIGSAAVVTSNTFPTNLPVFLPSDRFVYQVAPVASGRAVLRPDLTGQYTVTATIATTMGTTNVSVNLNAEKYMGVSVCEACHSGSPAPDIYPFWANTLHATMFTRGIDGILSSHYNSTCIKCHTVGYDTNASSLADNGFYSVAQKDNWTFPSVLASTNFAAMPANLQNLANIQCENCHGPGSDHAYAFGQTNTPGWPLLDVSYSSGVCNQCHDDAPGHPQGTQWYVSAHAGGLSTAATIPTGAGHDQCVQCHTANGFITAMTDAASTNTVFAPTNTAYTPIGCQTCHEPHGQTVPSNDSHLIRSMASVKFGNGTVITNGGEGNLCMNCHHSRDGSAVTNVANYPKGLFTWAGGSSFGPHDGPQGDMLEGINAITYGLVLPSSAHRFTVSNTCVGCHMQTLASTDPGFLLAGGHTFEMSYNVVTNGVTNKISKVSVCAQCHGQIASFDFPVEDYNGDGVIQGVQTEVQSMLNQLSTLLPTKAGVLDGLVKSSLSPTTNWTTAQLNAAYNWQFVANDGSLGVHNAPFATGLLKASIANLTGTSVPGGLPDSWVIQYFGSITNPNGAPNADPAGDGIPNWLKYCHGP